MSSGGGGVMRTIGPSRLRGLGELVGMLGVRKVVELHHRGRFHQESTPVVWPTSIR